MYQLEGTFDQINRGATPVSWVLDDLSGIPVTGETTTKCFNLQEIPMEFIRVNKTAGGGSVVVHIVQQGADT